MSEFSVRFRIQAPISFLLGCRGDENHGSTYDATMGLFLSFLTRPIGASADGGTCLETEGYLSGCFRGFDGVAGGVAATPSKPSQQTSLPLARTCAVCMERGRLSGFRGSILADT